MRIAKDGKPFDIDNIGESITPDEVEVIQFLRPNGRRRRMAVLVGQKTAELAEELILSAEELTTGQIAIYVRKDKDPEDKELSDIADNGPGGKSPTEVLIRLIRKIIKREDK